MQDKVEVNMIDISNNNELAKPMGTGGDNIYTAKSSSQGGNNPYQMGNTNTYPDAQKQVIIIEQPLQNVTNFYYLRNVLQIGSALDQARSKIELE